VSLFVSIFILFIMVREEGDSNSRGRKTNGLAIHRRAGLGHPRLWNGEIRRTDKKVFLTSITQIGDKDLKNLSLTESVTMDWAEKYRPKTLGELAGQQRIAKELRRWGTEWKQGLPTHRALILSGRAGIGKTSAAYALAYEMGWAAVELNTSDARNAKTIQRIATSGALHETFDDQGRFTPSREGGRKLIILDEADNLYERPVADAASIGDLSDKGGKEAIVETVRATRQPIILIVNDYYSLIKGSGESLKRLCRLFRFYPAYPSHIVAHLKRICHDEKVTVETTVLQSLADHCKGDIRSAVNDLQALCLDRTHVDEHALHALGSRDRETDIFEALQELFTSRSLQGIRETMMHLDEDPEYLSLWINENLPRQYTDPEDLAHGYRALAQADVFLGRTHRRQQFRLWSYACDLMNGGVGLAKTHPYRPVKYGFPTWLKQGKSGKSQRVLHQSIIEKINDACHQSKEKGLEFLLMYFKAMFAHDTTFALAMQKRYAFSDSELEFLLGTDHIRPFKDLLRPSSKKEQKDDTSSVSPKQEKKVEKEKVQQQRLFVF
jgi:replication factor C large subunit